MGRSLDERLMNADVWSSSGGNRYIIRRVGLSEDKMNKSLLLVTAFATFMAGATLPSYAGNVSAEIQVGSSYHQGGDYPYPYPGYDDSDDYDDEEDQISCSEGRQVVRQSGFRKVQPVRCSGDIYRYRAIRRGKIWTVRLDSWSGRIVSARVVRNY
jgi:hypothetical protein